MMVPLLTTARITAIESTSIDCDHPNTHRAMVANVTPMTVATPGRYRSIQAADSFVHFSAIGSGTAPDA
jgi:hypothetical protein